MRRGQLAQRWWRYGESQLGAEWKVLRRAYTEAAEHDQREPADSKERD